LHGFRPVSAARRREAEILNAMFDAYIGTTGGVLRLRDTTLDRLGLERERVMAIHAWAERDAIAILAGTYGNGLLRSADGGRTWSRIEAGLTASAFRFLVADPGHPGALLAGTEPARIFRSEDAGQTWHELDGITRIDGHERWFLPYSPRAGAARNVYVTPGRPGRLLVAAEVAGLLRSDDDGRTWVCGPVTEDRDEDLHHVTGHPDDPDLLYVALGTASLTPQARGDPPRRHGGIARSRDGGMTWNKLETDYTRATIVPPARPELLLAGPATQVGRGGRIVVSTDGGDTWKPAGTGVAMPMSDMVEFFVAAPDDSVWAVCSQGRLLRAMPDDWSWSSALPTGADVSVKSVAFVNR
jgi:photosystem II stability/assembly factor-like uncharacterized protein